MFEFDREAFLVNWLVKAAPLVFVNFKACADESVALVFVDKVRC